MTRPRRTDITGMRFGKLVVLERDGHGVDKGGKRYSLWKCKCDCGNMITLNQHLLVGGNRKSCGCIRNKYRNIQKQNHGMSHTKLYHIYNGILCRCCNKNDMHYKDYGGRGITICDEWKNDFLSFYKWAMNNGYKSGLSIDRIDVNGNYEPNNCRWATNKEQQKNKRNNVRYSVNGESLLMQEIVEKYKIPEPTLRGRMKKYNISMEEAIKYKKPLKTITYHGETKTAKEWSEITGISHATLLYRLKKGYTEDEIFIPAIVGYKGRRNVLRG